MENVIRIDQQGKCFGYRGSSLFVGERVFRTETGATEQQLFIDLPRKEPRKLIEPEVWKAPNPKDLDSMKDKEVTTEADIALNGILFMRPVSGADTLQFDALIERAGLFVQTGAGEMNCCFDGLDTIRVRGQGHALRIYAPLLDHEAAIDRQDGTYQVCIEASCEALFVPLRGRAVMDNPWSLWHGGTEKILLDILPDDDGVYELAVHITPSSTVRFEQYRSFEECLHESAARYTDWLCTEGKEDNEEAYRAWIDLYVPPSDDERAEVAGSESLRYEAALRTKPLVPKETRADIILSSTGDYDLRAVPFSRKGSFLSVLENDDDRTLYLSVTRSPEMWSQRLYLVKLTPVLDNIALPFEYDVEPGRLMIRTCMGRIEMSFDDGHRLHIRGTSVRLRMQFKTIPFENCVPKGNGAWEVSLSVVGRLLCVPVAGALYCDAKWDVEKRRADDFIMEWIPPVGSDQFEAVIENDYNTIARLDRYMSFDDCVRDSEREFEYFRKRYPALHAQYARQEKLAAWVIWIHMLGPSGNLKHPVVYMTRTQWTRAFGWQQSFQAMAASGDIHEAWKLLLTIFDYLDKGGQIPDSVGDIGATYRVTKPALQGLAMLYLMDRCDTSGVTREEYADLYDKMTRFTNWWLIFRDRNKSGLPQYFHSDESPGEFCSVFREGMPLYASDVAAFVALMADACSKLAERLDDGENAARWAEISKSIVARMVDMLWDGDRFLSKMVKTGKVVENENVLCMLPVMLGDRLPADVLEKLIAHLSSEEEFLAPNGITMENMRASVGKPVPRGAVVFQSVLVCVGLMIADRKALAKEIARRSVSVMVEKGFGFLDVKEKQKIVSLDANMPREKQPSKTAKWSSWTCACYFILADIAGSGEE